MAICRTYGLDRPKDPLAATRRSGGVTVEHRPTLCRDDVPVIHADHFHSFQRLMASRMNFSELAFDQHTGELSRTK